MNRTTCTITYEDSEKLIHQVCWKWQRRNGGDHDELVSIANEAYLRAYTMFDPRRGRWTTLLYRCIWNALTSHARAEGRKRERYRHPACLARAAAPRNRLQELLSELSDDAQAVARLVLDTPAELCDLAAGSTPKRWKALMRTYLYGFGWTAERVTKSLAELHEALA